MKEYSKKKFDGYVIFYRDKVVHRENDLPAIIFDDGTKMWFQNGKRHRETGPAIIYDNGTEMWYKNGRLHREAGPAFIGSDGIKEYWLNGIQYSEEYYYNKIGKPYLLTFL